MCWVRDCPVHISRKMINENVTADASETATFVRPYRSLPGGSNSNPCKGMQQGKPTPLENRRGYHPDGGAGGAASCRGVGQRLHTTYAHEPALL